MVRGHIVRKQQAAGITALWRVQSLAHMQAACPNAKLLPLPDALKKIQPTQNKLEDHVQSGTLSILVCQYIHV
jgi:hypothetical protein